MEGSRTRKQNIWRFFKLNFTKFHANSANFLFVLLVNYFLRLFLFLCYQNAPALSFWYRFHRYMVTSQCWRCAKSQYFISLTSEMSVRFCIAALAKFLLSCLPRLPSSVYNWFYMRQLVSATQCAAHCAFYNDNAAVPLQSAAKLAQQKNAKFKQQTWPLSWLLLQHLAACRHSTFKLAK